VARINLCGGAYPAVGGRRDACTDPGAKRATRRPCIAAAKALEDIRGSGRSTVCSAAGEGSSQGVDAQGGSLVMSILHRTHGNSP
jgi:hypothetical protein